MIKLILKRYSNFALRCGVITGHLRLQSTIKFYRKTLNLIKIFEEGHLICLTKNYYFNYANEAIYNHKL